MDRSRHVQRLADANPHADSDSYTHSNANSDTHADAHADANTRAEWIRVQSLQGHEHQHELEYVRDGHGSDRYGDSGGGQRWSV
jgi:hypothetical protein